MIHNDKCAICYWYGKCNEEDPCDDFTPIDDSLDEDFYSDVVRENYEEYQLLVEEQQA